MFENIDLLAAPTRATLRGRNRLDSRSGVIDDIGVVLLSVERGWVAESDQRGRPGPRALSPRWMSLVPPPTTYMIDRRSPCSNSPPPGTPGTSEDSAAAGPRISRVASP